MPGPTAPPWAVTTVLPRYNEDKQVGTVSQAQPGPPGKPRWEQAVGRTWAPPSTASPYEGRRPWARVVGKSSEFRTGGLGWASGAARSLRGPDLPASASHARRWGIRCRERTAVSLHLHHLPPTWVSVSGPLRSLRQVGDTGMDIHLRGRETSVVGELCLPWTLCLFNCGKYTKHKCTISTILKRTGE